MLEKLPYYCTTTTLYKKCLRFRRPENLVVVENQTKGDHALFPFKESFDNILLELQVWQKLREHFVKILAELWLKKCECHHETYHETTSFI